LSLPRPLYLNQLNNNIASDHRHTLTFFTYENLPGSTFAKNRRSPIHRTFAFTTFSTPPPCLKKQQKKEVRRMRSRTNSNHHLHITCAESAITRRGDESLLDFPRCSWHNQYGTLPLPQVLPRSQYQVIDYSRPRDRCFDGRRANVSVFIARESILCSVGYRRCEDVRVCVAS
jgi:hypothetical protein